MIAGGRRLHASATHATDLNLNEQEWKELIEELNRSVPDEDMKDLFNEDFEEEGPRVFWFCHTDPLGTGGVMRQNSLQRPLNRNKLGSPQVRGWVCRTDLYRAFIWPCDLNSPSLGGSQPLFHTAGQPGVDSPSPSLMPASAQAQNARPPVWCCPSQGPGGGSGLPLPTNSSRSLPSRSVSRCSRTRNQAAPAPAQARCPRGSRRGRHRP